MGVAHAKEVEEDIKAGIYPDKYANPKDFYQHFEKIQMVCGSRRRVMSEGGLDSLEKEALRKFIKRLEKEGEMNSRSRSQKEIK